MYNFTYFRCDKCGKEIYEYKRQKDIKNALTHIDCYVIEDNGQKIEICPQCYKKIRREE